MLATLKYVVMPNVESHAADIQARVSEATGMDVRAATIKGGWSGFSPYVEMTAVELREPAKKAASAAATPAGAVALKLPAVRAAVSIPYLLVGQVRFAEVAVFRPELVLTRKPDGHVYFAGRALSRKSDTPDDGRLMEWLLDQPGIEIHHAGLRWQDETTAAPDLVLSDVGIHIEKSFGRHLVGVVATPPAALAAKLDVRARLDIEPAAAAASEGPRWKVAGTVYADVRDVNLSEVRRHLNVPDNWQSGTGSLRAWVNMGDTRTTNPVTDATADVHIVNAVARLGEEVAPLAVSRLAGRIVYKQLDQGFTIASTKLELRTREGVVLPPADFSLSLQGGIDKANGRGEVTANGIDLKVMTALIDYFPIGRELRQFARETGLRGAVHDARYAWTGAAAKPATYQVKGRLSEFGSQARLSTPGIPGISGFSGSVEGNEKGGRFSVASKSAALDIATMFREPIKFDHLEGEGKWALTDRDLTVSLAELKMANRDLKADLKGDYVKLRAPASGELPPEKRPGRLDVVLRIAEADATRIPAYFPNAISRTREYLEWAIRDGKVFDARLAIKGEIYDFPFHNGVGGQFDVKAGLKDIDFRYAEGWPVANDINGEFTMNNTALAAKVSGARFFNASVRKTELSVADTYVKPMLLAIAGEADARAEDVSRYLRESPLVDGVGAFTRFVSLEGPGKLNIDLKIPIGVPAEDVGTPRAPRFRLNGRYQLQRGAAKLALGTEVTGLGGQIQFSESGVKSTGIAGVAYGNPITFNINGGGEAGVTTEFAGRAEVQQLNHILPFAMPQQVSGSTDVAGKLSSTRTGVELAIESNLTGVTATLPPPLAKRADEPRRLKLVFSDLGQKSEQIKLALAGNQTGNAAAPDAPQSRVDARFQRKWDDAGHAAFFGGVASVGTSAPDTAVPEGLWLQGRLSQLDYDLWQRAVENFYPRQPAPAASGAAPAATADTGSPITGFDFTLDRLIAYGRPFNEVKIRGRKSSERQNPAWAMSIASRDAEGDITWRAAAFNERGAVRARLKKLVISEETAAATPAGAPAGAAAATDTALTQDLPALDVVADDFTFKGRWLGKVELKATPLAENWRIDQLMISNGHAKAEMSGLWQRHGDPYAPPRAGPVKSLTTMDIKVSTTNLNALFAQFGFGDYMKGGRGGLEGRLSWPGHTYQFQTQALSGQFKVDAERGQFAKVEAGAGKLLGLISLQSIPRRLTFDFRDLFSDGFAFDRIEGDITIADGVMQAKKFDIAGPAADVRMAGDVSLPTERQNLTMTVAPKLSAVAAVGAGVLVNPLVGLGVLLGGEVLKSPIERVLSVQYSVTGTWDNPVVERTGRTVAPTAPPAPAPSSTGNVPPEDANKKKSQ